MGTDRALEKKYLAGGLSYLVKATSICTVPMASNFPMSLMTARLASSDNAIFPSLPSSQRVVTSRDALRSEMVMVHDGELSCTLLFLVLRCRRPAVLVDDEATSPPEEVLDLVGLDGPSRALAPETFL